MKKRSVTVYPYIKEFYEVIKYFDDLNTEFYIESVVTLRGFRANGKDVSYFDNRKELGCLLSDDFNESIKNSEALLVTPVNKNAYYRKEILGNIALYIENGKDIICTMHLKENELTALRRKAEKSKTRFDYYSRDSFTNIYKNENKHSVNMSGMQLYRPCIPVIFIGESFPISRSGELVLGLKVQFEKLGYSTTALCCSHYGELLQTISFPGFMFSNCMLEKSKALEFNQYIKNLLNDQKTDILLVELPGAMLSYDDIFTNGFGIYPFIISQVLTPDFFILVDKFSKKNNNYYNMINANFVKRFGFKLDAVCLTNCYFDNFHSKNVRKICLRNLDYRQVDKLISNEHEIPMINAMDGEPETKLASLIINKLS